MGSARNILGTEKQAIYFAKKNKTCNSNEKIFFLDYRLKAKILYSGNGRSGHYVSVRRKLKYDQSL